MSSRAEKSESNKWRSHAIIAVILVLCLILITYALVRLSVTSDNQYFRTGEVSINLNDGKPVIGEDEYKFEPGMTVNKEFFVKNTGTAECYYKLYMTEVEGTLQDIIDITIYRDGDNGRKILYEGKVTELTGSAAKAADDILKAGEKRQLYITFHYPELEGNRGQAGTLSFTFNATATQTKNNPDREF